MRLSTIFRRTRYIHTPESHNTDSAQEIVPLLLQQFRPASVVDVGCGTGSWLKVFAEHGVEDYLGVEGVHLDFGKLEIPPSHVVLLDLEQPFLLSRRFDLVVCLEVAEHLSPSAALPFIESLVKLGDTILFSAAIPNQGGQRHINEQWLSYWQELFNGFGFVVHDVFRRIFWNNDRINWWYRQNLVLAVRQGSPFDRFPEEPVLDLVHPVLFTKHASELQALYEGKAGLWTPAKILIKTLLRKIGLPW